MREYRQPLKKRLQKSAWFQQRYRTDPEYRLARVNERRAAAGKPLANELPPVGEAKRQWAATRQRDGKGRFVPESMEIE